MLNPEIVGSVAAILVLVSMMFDTKTKKGTILMRVINLIASFITIWYSSMLHAYSSIILNVILAIVNSFYLWRIFKGRSS